MNLKIQAALVGLIFAYIFCMHAVNGVRDRVVALEATLAQHRTGHNDTPTTISLTVYAPERPVQISAGGDRFWQED